MATGIVALTVVALAIIAVMFFFLFMYLMVLFQVIGDLFDLRFVIRAQGQHEKARTAHHVDDAFDVFDLGPHGRVETIGGVRGDDDDAGDPLEAIARLAAITREMQLAVPGLPVIASGYTWLRHLMPYAAAGTIRGDYSSSRQMNLVHASDSPQSAQREIAVFFTPDEIHV